MTEAQAHTILYALDLWERDMAAIGGCVVTDRPDLPLSQVGWKWDFRREWQAMLDARAAVMDALPMNSILRVDENISPPMKRLSVPAKCDKAPMDSHIILGDCS